MAQMNKKQTTHEHDSAYDERPSAATTIPRTTSYANQLQVGRNIDTNIENTDSQNINHSEEQDQPESEAEPRKIQPFHLQTQAAQMYGVPMGLGMPNMARAPGDGNYVMNNNNINSSTNHMMSQMGMNLSRPSPVVDQVVRKGSCKWFNSQKGFGFITPSDGTGDVFVHQSVIKADGFRSLAEGEPVEYYLDLAEPNKTKAAKVTGPAGANVQGATAAAASLLFHQPHNMNMNNMIGANTMLNMGVVNGMQMPGVVAPGMNMNINYGYPMSQMMHQQYSQQAVQARGYQNHVQNPQLFYQHEQQLLSRGQNTNAGQSSQQGQMYGMGFGYGMAQNPGAQTGGSQPNTPTASSTRMTFSQLTPSAGTSLSPSTSMNMNVMGFAGNGYYDERQYQKGYGMLPQQIGSPPTESWSGQNSFQQHSPQGDIAYHN